MPQALRVLRLAPGRAYCTLKRLSFEMGWKYKDVIAELEVKRKTRSAAFYAAKKKTVLARTKAAAAAGAELAPLNKELAALCF